jgi:hypothetical protein
MMERQSSYWSDGYLALQSFLPDEVGRAFLAKLKADLVQARVPFDLLKQESHLLRQKAIEVYGGHYPPMITFLWGMTPAVAAHIGRRLRPTYCYFRVYREGDICRIHSDRYACEHSLSLLLAASDNRPWSLEVGAWHIDNPRQRADADFGEEPFASLPMRPGDAVLYQGVHRAHGRMTPNPNRWSAHLFLHWVDEEGAYAEEGFERQAIPDTSRLEL